MHGSKLTTPDALERGLRLATRAIVRVRTRFDARTCHSAQMPGGLPMREQRDTRTERFVGRRSAWVVSPRS